MSCPTTDDELTIALSAAAALSFISDLLASTPDFNGVSPSVALAAAAASTGPFPVCAFGSASSGFLTGFFASAAVASTELTVYSYPYCTVPLQFSNKSILQRLETQHLQRLKTCI